MAEESINELILEDNVTARIKITYVMTDDTQDFTALFEKSLMVLATPILAFTTDV